MTAGDLTTLASVRTHLGMDVGFTADDTLLGTLITACSAWMRHQLDRDIAAATYTAETSSGNDGTTLIPRHYPITSVTSLAVDGDAIPARPSVTEDGYVISGQLAIKLVGYTFADGIDNVVITYTAGFSTIPEDIAQACNELVAWRYKERNRIGQVSTSVGGESVTFSTFAAPQSVNLVLAAHRRYAV